jgi:hypothetical protein
LLTSAKIEEWKDPQGKVFKGEPAENLGPFALFRTISGSGIRFPWRVLSPADCVRFEQQVAGRPGPAARWSDATGQLTERLRGHVGIFEGVNLVKPKLELLPEPTLLLVFYVDNSASGSWEMISKSIQPYHELLARHPGQVAALQFGVNHSPQEHSDVALRSQAPWLLVEYEDQRRIPSLFRLSPKRQEFALFVVSRDGVPVFGASNPDEAGIKKLFSDTDAMLSLLRAENPLGWQDRAHYLSAVQSSRHQQDQAGPVLVGNPLVAKGLHDRGIYRVAATIEVGADGKVTGVALKDQDSIPEPMRQPLASALQRSAVFVPAVDHGKFVAGTYDYLVEVPR